MFDIDGSSFKGQTDSNNIIGSWWNHEIINKKHKLALFQEEYYLKKLNF